MGFAWAGSEQDIDQDKIQSVLTENRKVPKSYCFALKHLPKNTKTHPAFGCGAVQAEECGKVVACHPRPIQASS